MKEFVWEQNIGMCPSTAIRRLKLGANVLSEVALLWLSDGRGGNDSRIEMRPTHIPRPSLCFAALKTCVFRRAVYRRKFKLIA